MTIPIWPADLPRPMRNGWSRTLPDGRLATRPETGPPRVRRRWSAAVSAVQMTIDVSADGLMRFWRFWEETRMGALPFLMPDWPLDGLGLATDEGEGLAEMDDDGLEIAAWCVVMFGTEQPPSEAPVGVRWRISIPLSILP